MDLAQTNLYGVRGRRILVAGGTGLVGANLTDKLYSLGSDVHSTFFSKKPPFLKDSYRQFDFSSFQDCLDSTRGMECVFICAAKTAGIGALQDNQSISVAQNLKISSGLLEACRVNKVEKIIIISSSTVYQEAPYPIREEQLDLNQPPCGIYFGVGWMNRYIEKLATFYFKEYGMKIGIARAANIYGPHDKFDERNAHVIPSLIKRALRKENPYVVWGNPDTIRDFIFVEDFVEDLLDVFDRYTACDPVNVGSGESLTIDSAARVILEVCGNTISPAYDRDKPTAINYRMLNIEKFNSLFGRKKRTPFKEGIRKTVEWYKSQ